MTMITAPGLASRDRPESSNTYESPSWPEHCVKRPDRLLFRGRPVSARPTPSDPRPTSRRAARRDRRFLSWRATLCRWLLASSVSASDCERIAGDDACRIAGRRAGLERGAGGFPAEEGGALGARARRIKGGGGWAQAPGLGCCRSSATGGIHRGQRGRNDPGCRTPGLRLDRSSRFTLAGQSRCAATEGFAAVYRNGAPDSRSSVKIACWFRVGSIPVRGRSLLGRHRIKVLKVRCGNR
jgi:hypothetical protein